MSREANRIRVLHVDDEPDFASLAAEFLEREDERIDIVTATDADDGIAYLQAHEVDCIVSDYEMPGTNGIEFLESVRETHPELPFILFTGKGSEEIASDAISAGVTDYLQKESGTGQYAILVNRIVNSVESRHAKQDVKRLRRLSTAFPDVILYIGENGRYLDVLAGGTNLLFDKADLLGERIQSVHPPELADRFMGTIDLAIETGRVQTIEYAFDQEESGKWSQARIVPVRRSAGNRWAVLWASREITERKKQEQQLERYGHLVDAMEDPVAIYDTEGRYEVVTEPLLERYDTTADELLGERSQLVELLGSELEGNPYRELIEGEREELLATFQSPSVGEDSIMEYRFTRLMIDGRCEGTVCVSRDVTDRGE